MEPGICHVQWIHKAISTFFITLHTWLQITNTAFGKIFSREEILSNLAVFPEIRQIKLMIRQIKFPQKNTFVSRKIKFCWKKKNFNQLQNCSLFENTFSKNSHHIETSKLICSSNQLTGFYMIRISTEQTKRCPYFFRFFFHAISPTSLYTKVLAS